ncbi:DNA-binding transcriptional regulator, MarR family [Dethiosulfatibacter aminovorans DSM 17477]|uniref:DNA-binding transcriptional regulator, MarR family n=1 Tax=Dethiosulfatibacter aminovorans DSM 17477 TaxID=1121476 RepID=A0A1M6GAQ7_9FIRM|nr:MarR family transcriptional regulator [Dethiosulfatibacter aminovorans]SHJ07041.1 DNA-binding transcriptional regulator, MarR family [Dethiosulfatibacter aminovorans DSM 17477]
MKYNERILETFKKVKTDYFEYLKELSSLEGFTQPQTFMIYALHRFPGIGVQELSDRLRLSKSNVSSTVDRLVGQGVVRREIPKENRRRVKLYLSEEFVSKTDVEQIRINLLANLFPSATEEDYITVIKGLERLQTLVEANRKEEE